jgi:hypothetical protein
MILPGFAGEAMLYKTNESYESTEATYVLGLHRVTPSNRGLDERR